MAFSTSTIQAVYQIPVGYGLRDARTRMAAASGVGGGGGLQAVPLVAAEVPFARAAVRGFWLAAVFGLVAFMGLRAAAGLEAALLAYGVIVAAVVAIMVLRL